MRDYDISLAKEQVEREARAVGTPEARVMVRQIRSVSRGKSDLFHIAVLQDRLGFLG